LSIAEFVYNNSYYVSVETSSFYLIYDYYSEIYYKVENNFTEEKISSAQKRVKQLYNLRKVLAKRFESAVAQQTKYYNKKYKSKSFVIEKLIILSTRNLKQKKSSKKISHKYVELFRIIVLFYSISIEFIILFIFYFWSYICIAPATSRRNRYCKLRNLLITKFNKRSKKFLTESSQRDRYSTRLNK